MALILIVSMIGIWSEFLSKISDRKSDRKIFFLKIGIGAYSEKTWSCPTLVKLQISYKELRSWVSNKNLKTAANEGGTLEHCCF
jgi:hypothetical protein